MRGNSVIDIHMGLYIGGANGAIAPPAVNLMGITIHFAPPRFLNKIVNLFSMFK